MDPLKQARDYLRFLAARYRHQAGVLFGEGKDEEAAKYRDAANKVEHALDNTPPLPGTVPRG